MRTHYCGEVNSKAINQLVELYGWVNKVRNHGKLIFIDLRDRSGIVQVVVNQDQSDLFALAEKFHNEFVLQITGKIQARPAGLVNSEMRTGEIEIVVTDIIVLATAEPLPFVLDEFQTAHDDLRLRYRYLDLRRQELTEKIWFRAKVAKKIRQYFDDCGFIEIETPMLTKTTPEGARDFLVPSRNFKGEFYALPQSPQIFKQLLMAAGFDRYYQLVRCFRDEDLRADRQPEFTQLDVELAFTSEAEIMQLIEEMLRQLFKELLQVVLPNPFLKITYKEAMEKYGSDKPDLRIPLEIIELTDLMQNVGFEVFAKFAHNPQGRIAALCLPNAKSLSRKQLDGYTEFVGIYGLKGLANIKVNDVALGLQGLQSSILKFFDKETIERIISRVNPKSGDIIFIAASENKIVNEALGALRVKLGHDHNLVSDSWQPLWVVDFPCFEKTETGWTFLHHPFTAPVENNIEEILKNPGAVMARAYDMVLNGTELGGGSIRIHNREMQLAVFKILGIDPVLSEQQFGHLLESFKYGYPPEGGIAFGLDRIVMLMTKSKSIREVIAFPKTQTGSCLLTGAPSKVTASQLSELGIKV
ncbi:MAG: aspartate--tRNA ligase [Gammaproteobacteria bacterium]|nr:aspartate--tRNA ligase [Gammaproteobacteria bacterium]